MGKTVLCRLWLSSGEAGLSGHLPLPARPGTLHITSASAFSKHPSSLRIIGFLSTRPALKNRYYEHRVLDSTVYGAYNFK